MMTDHGLHPLAGMKCHEQHWRAEWGRGGSRQGVKAGVKAFLGPYRCETCLSHTGAVPVLLPRFPADCRLTLGCYWYSKSYCRTLLDFAGRCAHWEKWVKYAIPFAASQPIHPEAFLSREQWREQPPCNERTAVASHWCSSAEELTKASREVLQPFSFSQILNHMGFFSSICKNE